MSSTQEVGEIFGAGRGAATALLRSPTVIIASVGLWGMNVYFFRLFGIDYRRVLLLDLVKEKAAREARERAAEERRRRVSRGRGKRSGNDVVRKDGGGGAMESGMSNEEQDAALDKMEKRSDAGGHNAEMELAALIADEEDDTGSGVDMEIPSTPRRGVKSRAAVAKAPGAPGMQITDGGGDHSTTPSKMSPSKHPPPSSSDSMKALLESGKPNCDVTAFNLLTLSLCLLVTLHVSTYAYIHLWGGSTVGAVFAYYAVVALGIAVPLPRTRWIRVAVRTVLRRTFELLNPRCACLSGDAPRPIPFIDVFFADAMCSLSKVFFDWGMLWHLASHYPDPVPPSFHAIVIPSLCASWPYLCRARQCLIMHEVGRLKNDPKRYQHMLNAIKYSTSLFPLLVSAFQKTDAGERHKEGLERLLVVLCVVNSLYSFAWDVIMDWGMMDNPRVVLERTLTPCSSITDLPPSMGGGEDSSPGSSSNGSTSSHHHRLPPHRGGRQFDSRDRPNVDCSQAFLRPRLRFGFSTSLLILVADAFLRFFWVARFFESRVFPSNDAYVLTTEFLEVFRRAIWNLLRVEWENIKQGRSGGGAASAGGGGAGGLGSAGGDAVKAPTAQQPSSSSVLSGAPTMGAGLDDDSASPAVVPLSRR